MTYPLNAFEALSNLGLVNSAACMLSFGYAKASPIKDPQTFHDWVRNQFGEKLFSIFFKTYTEKVWGMSCDEISADWASQRIKGLDLGVAVMNGLKRALNPRDLLNPDKVFPAALGCGEVRDLAAGAVRGIEYV